MGRIKLKDLQEETKISKEQMRQILAGTLSWGGLAEIHEMYSSGVIKGAGGRYSLNDAFVSVSRQAARCAITGLLLH